MIQKQKIKKLAQIAAQSNNIPEDIEKFVLTQLGKEDLKSFLRFFKIALDKKRVYISSPETLTNNELSLFKSHFRDKEIIVSVDSSLGGGVVVREDDMVVDFSFKNYINETVEKLKN